MSDEPKTINEIASLGGKAAAKNMTAKARSERAKQAASARWRKEIPHSELEGELKIGEATIACAVLSGPIRVISQRSMSVALGRHVTGSGPSRTKPSDGVAKLPTFLIAANLKPFIDGDLLASLLQPLEYIPKHGGRTAYGFNAELFPRICDVWLKARDADVLTAPQKITAEKAYILMRALAHVGIIALVDEATGYQDARAKDALAKILEEFVAKELRDYIKTFEIEYYKEIARLKGWEFKSSLKMPRYLGKITNDLVYSRLAPGVLEELRQKNPIAKSGRREAKHFQWLTDHRGHPELQKHLSRITGWMEMSKTWEEFYRILNERKPVYSGRTLFSIRSEDEDTTFSSIELGQPSVQSLPAAQE